MATRHFLVTFVFLIAMISCGNSRVEYYPSMRLERAKLEARDDLIHVEDVFSQILSKRLNLSLRSSLPLHLQSGTETGSPW